MLIVETIGVYKINKYLKYIWHLVKKDIYWYKKGSYDSFEKQNKILNGMITL